MKLSDGSRVCTDCEQIFALDEGEQQFFERMDFALPVRCPECRRLRKELARQAAINLASEQLGQ